MGNSTFGIGKPQSCTTESKPMTKCASAPCGTRTRPPRSSPAAGTDRSNSGTKERLLHSLNELKEIHLLKATGLVSSLTAMYFIMSLLKNIILTGTVVFKTSAAKESSTIKSFLVHLHF